MTQERKAYQNLGLTKEDVLKIQHWLFPMMNETEIVSQMIVKVVGKYPDGMKRLYAIFLLGHNLGEARIKERFGVTHILNPETV